MSPQIVLMTGCSAGIGLATAQRLARDPGQRYMIFATVIAMSEKDDLVAAVGDALDKTVFIKELDICKDDDITSVVDYVINTHGRIDVLINVAGVIVIGVPESITREQIDKCVGVNLIGTIRLTQKVLPHMKQNRAGKIITVTSIGGRIGWPYFDVYVATKFGLEGFFESLAGGVKSFNIRVCMVEPIGVQTNMLIGGLKQFRALSEDDSFHDIDRRQVTRQMENLEANSYLSASDIAEVLGTRCLDAADPTLRHLVCSEEMKAAIGMSVVDLTGQTALAICSKIFEAS